MNNSHSKWAAAVLGFISPPIGMLYVANPIGALVYFFAVLGIGVLSLMYSSEVGLAAILNIVVSIIGAVHSYRLAIRYPADKARPRYSRWYGLAGIYLCVFGMAFIFRAFLFEPFRFPSESMVPTVPSGSYLFVQKWGYGHYGSYGVIPFHRKITSELRRGDIVAFDWPVNPSTQYVKRLIALPGDKVAYLDKRLTINGKAIHQKEIERYFSDSRHENMLRVEESIGENTYTVFRNESAEPNTSVLRNFVRSFEFREKCKYEDRGVTCEVPAEHYFFIGDNRDNSNDSRYWGFVPASHIIGKVVYISN